MQAAKTVDCLIIDDDSFIQELLTDKLQQYFPELQIIGVASSGKEGIEKIQSLSPKLVFLDVEMGDMTGFEMLSALSEISFKTIFITSFQHYAIKAIRFNALDYLLKPFDLEELKNAVRRFKKDVSDNVPIALENFKAKNIKDQTLVLKTQQGELHLKLKNIIYISGERNYSYIHLDKGKKELVSKTLSNLEELLDEKDFYRCHKSYLVNKVHIVSEPIAVQIKLSNGQSIPISRRKKDAFLHWFRTLGERM